jgi:hypothetical protein
LHGHLQNPSWLLISGILNDMGVKLHMPSFKGTERTQLTSSDTIRSENISKVRIHVERAIQRTKTFHLIYQGVHRVLKLGVQWGTIAVFSLTLYPCKKKVPTILGVQGLFWG